MRRAFLLALASSLVAVACGGGGDAFIALGGGGVGSGGTGAVASVVASGPVEGFGSIIVNGTRYDTDRARFDLRDSAQLKLGMTVAVTGTVSADLATGTAEVVSSAAQLRGGVEALDVGAGQFTVLGVRVVVDDSTVFADASGLAGLAGPVVVWGLPRAGELLATRIEPLRTAAAEAVVTDTVRSVDAAARSFRLGGVLVSYAGLPGPAPAVGQLLRVRGNADRGTLVATSVEAADPPVPAQDRTVVSVSGGVARWDGNRFQLDGYTVDATRARIIGGLLREGAWADVTGVLQDGTLVAQRIRLRRGAGAERMAFSSAGEISAFESPTRFSVRGQAVDASNARIEAKGSAAASLAPGRKVKVTGSRVQGDVLVAERVEVLD